MIFGPFRGATLGLSSGRRQDRFWIAYLGSSAQFAPQRKRYATSAMKLWLEQCLDLVGKFLVRKVPWPTKPEAERSNLATPPYQICCGSIESALKRCVLMPILP